jgi:FixJ family two-component response regulator
MGHLEMTLPETMAPIPVGHDAGVGRSEAAVHIVDDDEPLRNAIRRVLQLAGYRVRTYASAGEFLLDRPDHLNGCLVLDIRMPGPTGLDLQESLARRGTVLPIIFLTANGDLPMCVQAMQGGAVDFLAKPAPREVLLAAVQRAMRRGSKMLADRARMQALESCYSTLTVREREVLAGVVRGKLNKTIASELGSAERTIKAHRARLMEKMHCGSLAELVHVSEQLQLLAPVT